MVYAGASETAPPLYSSTGSLHRDLANIRNRSSWRPTTPSGEPEPAATTSLDIRRNELPDYTTTADTEREQTLAITDFLVDEDEDEDQVREQMDADVVAALFRAIANGQDEIINAFISSGLATVRTRDILGRTPMAAACEAGHIRIVQQLVDFGANVDEFSSFTSPSNDQYSLKGIERTPLMIAAERGNLPLVKLLVEVFHADDSLIAPDGQLALRLAASNKHQEVVNFLPIRRGGGMRRWKYKNQKAVARMKKAGKKIYKVGRFFFWSIPKFFVWDLPKHVIVLPLWKQAKWLHANRAHLLGWMWSWMKRTTKATAVFIGKIPGRTWRFAKWFSKAMVKVAKWSAEALKDFSKYLYKSIIRFVTVSLPKVTKQVIEFIGSAVVSIVKLLGDFVGRIISAIHTTVMVVLRFIKDLTWKDVWNGIVDVFRFIFVTLPTSLWEGMKATCRFTAKMISSIFGRMGDCFIFMLLILKEMVIYIPKLIWKILTAVGDIFKRGTDEIRVWINPKTAV